MSERLYILSRTSGRPKFFARMLQSVRALTWPDVTLIVHTDDPRDTYVDGDIIVQGECYPPHMGRGTYNLYNNRLLDAIPGDGWVAFIDDDDEYASPGVFERLLRKADKRHIQTGQAARWGDHVWNTDPKVKKRVYQTECFVLWSSLAKRARWPGNKGGDHFYTRQLTRRARTVWHDVLIARAQEGKGSGRRRDAGGEYVDYDNALPPGELVWLKQFGHPERKRPRGDAGKLVQMTYRDAREMERNELGRVTYKGVNIVTPVHSRN